MLRNFNFDRIQDIDIESDTYVHNGFFKVREYKLRYRKFNGGWSDLIAREIFERGPVAAAIPYDPIKKKVILIEQFRTGAIGNSRPWLLEIVAGVAGKNEAPEAVIRREMLEETSLDVRSLYKIYDCWISPGGSDEYLTLYCAKVEAPENGGIYGLPEEGEDIYVHPLPVQEAFNLLAEGKIKNVITILALQWLQLNLSKIDELLE
jgi:ADP-ribose pyrophosphatase